jgi:KipI family sensor histidine kinase inhibitor
MRFLPVGKEALLVELADLNQTLSLLDSLQEQPITGVLELVPAARTILLKYLPHLIFTPDLVNEIASRSLSVDAKRSDVLVQIPVRYNGEDLSKVAKMLDLTIDEVIRRHSNTEWTVAFSGFAPGFSYLTGGDPCFNVPRRKIPRTSVPAGSVALAGNFSAVYPKASPGGWQIIGETDTPMWDLTRTPPALLQPGYRVRFVDANCEKAFFGGKKMKPVRHKKKENYGHGHTLKNNNRKYQGFTVINPGLFTVFQDLGRYGLAGNGVSASGALDKAALRAANRLVGNRSDLPLLESAGGLILQSNGDLVIAITGAKAKSLLVTIDGRSWSVPGYSPIALSHGDRVHIGQPTRGSRCYVAVRGGYKVSHVLGSASRDTLAHLGPEPLCIGQNLDVSDMALHSVSEPELPPENMPAAGEEVVLDIILGPRTDWFTAETPALMEKQCWEVSSQSNRIGLRLRAEEPIERVIVDELPSEGTVPGAIQVPPSGQPVIFLADHPLTGGYPVVGCVADHHLDLAGQIPAGSLVRFRVIRPFERIFSLPY